MTELESLYKMYFKDVYLYIKSLSGDEHIAEDITSETFIRAIKSIDTFRGDCDIRIWLCQIAKNSYFSFLRKNKKVIFTDTISERKSEINLEQLIVSKEDTLKIHKILHRLKEPYKEVFSLRVFGELSFKQIGDIFGKTENWACVTYHRSRKKIQREMEEYQ
ncbi:MAG: sigma-70 family RNA polymerase sigma factor [Caldicoprobacterales bacterium]|nr:sigma-70 family RNA polymerase sigma factor [Clostridiales bacterium]